MKKSFRVRASQWLVDFIKPKSSAQKVLLTVTITVISAVVLAILKLDQNKNNGPKVYQPDNRTIIYQTHPNPSRDNNFVASDSLKQHATQNNFIPSIDEEEIFYIVKTKFPKVEYYTSIPDNRPVYSSGQLPRDRILFVRSKSEKSYVQFSFNRDGPERYWIDTSQIEKIYHEN